MPLYQYKCLVCDEQFEAMQPMADRKEHPCPCGGSGRQQITPVRFDDAAMGRDPAFPTAYDKWAKRHEKAAKTGQL
jgi:putative FmdB family regulatory protein